jgi:hypothetical protein
MPARPESDRIAGGAEPMSRTRRANTGEAMGVGRDCEPGRIEPYQGARSRAFTDAQFHDKIMKACSPDGLPIVCGAFYATVQ